MRKWIPIIKDIMHETLALAALGAFLFTVAVWCGIFIWGW